MATPNISLRAIRMNFRHGFTSPPSPHTHTPHTPFARQRKVRRKKQALAAEKKRAQADKAKRGEPPGMEENTDELIQWLERMYVTCFGPHTQKPERAPCSRSMACQARRCEDHVVHARDSSLLETLEWLGHVDPRRGCASASPPRRLRVASAAVKNWKWGGFVLLCSQPSVDMWTCW